MSDIEVLRTPSPGSSESDTADSGAPNAKFLSPPSMPDFPRSPPPSTQILRSTATPTPKDLGSAVEGPLATPPVTVKIGTIAKHETLSSILPTLEETQDMAEAQLRSLANKLIPALGEARMAAAHARLQHSLLGIETAEAAQRAAVELGMMRREVDVLQAGSPILKNRSTVNSEPVSPQNQTRQHLEFAIKRNTQLETQTLHLQRRLKQAKKIIKQLDGKNTQLVEDNQLLRQRIKQNREHVDSMRASGIISVGNTPRPTHNTSSNRIKSQQPGSSRPRGQNPFDALLAAGQVLSGETNSVPSTPTHPRPAKYHASHTRGTHSLSSLPMTPNRSRPLTADNTISTPVNHVMPLTQPSYSAPSTQFVSTAEDRRREDRDSTISASDRDEAYTDDDVPASQASRIATNMLRNYSGPTPERSATSDSTEQEKSLVQSKLGTMAKISTGQAESKGKRSIDISDAEGDMRSIKRAKLDYKGADRMGLGIGVWPSPIN